MMESFRMLWQVKLNQTMYGSRLTSTWSKQTDKFHVCQGQTQILQQELIIKRLIISIFVFSIAYFIIIKVYNMTNTIKHNNTTYKIILLIAITISCTHAQLNCSNYYNINQQPPQCDQTTYSCTFPPFTNTTLIANITEDNQYALCLDLPEFSITIEQGTDSIDMSIYINSSSTTFSSGYSLQTKNNLIVQSINDITLNNASVVAGFVWFQAEQIELQSATIQNDGSFSTDCDCTSKATICTAPLYYFPYFYSDLKYPSTFNISLMNYTFQNWIFVNQDGNSVVLYARNSITIFNSTISISVISIYTTVLTISNSTLDNSGLGYSSGTGLGCGYFDQVLNQLLGCTGTGASHGGYGGNSEPQNCNLLLSRPPYDRDLIPKYPGSGGGFFLKSLTQVSAGGGVINIQVQSLTIDNSNISADGTNGIQGGGGGSGGSISIDFFNVKVLNSPNISASGGAGKSSGGGGRIRYFYHSWNTIAGNPGDNNLMVMANGGDCQGKLSCGQVGSIEVAPCPPGYYLNYSNFGCTVCQVGYYQLTYSYDECTPCMIKPANSYYNWNQKQLSDLSNYSIVCSFTCDEGYINYNDRECLSRFYYMLADVGGINIIICIGIIIATLVIYLIILMIRKLSFSDRNMFSELEPIDIYKKKSYFKIEDIPFHQMRIFFEGYNSPSSPWRIHEKVKTKLQELEEYHSNFPFFSRLITQINLIGEYNRPTKWLLYILKFTYYPLGLFLASAFRVHKAKQLRRLIVDKYKQNTQITLGIKLHVNTQHTIASLQLFNFKKQTLDFYIKNYFPIYFKLQKLHGGGYSIDFTDPIFKSLCNEFEEKDEKNVKLEDYLIELNQLLRNSDQELPIFKHLWKIHNAWPFLQCHLWQPENNILGIRDNMQINKNEDLFLVFSTESRPDNLAAVNINQSLPGSQLVFQNSRSAQNKVSRHFLSKNDLQNIYFDQISCIRHKYHLREAMIEMDEKKTIFWEIQNSFSEKTLSWILGAIDILELLLNLFSFFLVVFSLDQEKTSYVYVYIPYFVLFPFCEYFMIFLQFNLLISRVTKVFTFALYFTLFSMFKFLVLCIIILAITISSGFEGDIFLINFFLWIIILVFNVASLVLLCMLQTHYAKIK